MRPHDFIAAAGKLAAIAQGDEALLRSAVSRAYYGAFHLTLELLSAAGVDLPRNANAHVRCAACSQVVVNRLRRRSPALSAICIRIGSRQTIT